jgi:hypothetical protein
LNGTQREKQYAIAANVDVTSEDLVMNAIKDANLMWPDVPVGGVINCGGIGDLGMTIDRTGMPLHLDKYRKVIEINVSKRNSV